jgi:hypothetical protein
VCIKGINISIYDKMGEENIRFFARNPVQLQLRSDPIACQIVPLHHSYPTPRNLGHPHHQPFVPLAPYDPWVHVAVVMGVAAAVGMGTPALCVDKLVGAVVVEECWGLAGMK